MLSPVREDEYPPVLPESLVYRFDDQGIPVFDFSQNTRHASHVNLPKPSYGWRLLERITRIFQCSDLRRSLIDPLNLEELGTKKPIEETR